jgi:hypothetical protein
VNHAGCWQGNERRRHPLPAQRKRAGAKKEQHGEASKKSQKKLQLKTQEEDQRRKSANFKPPSSADFQNAADTGTITPQIAGSNSPQIHTSIARLVAR